MVIWLMRILNACSHGDRGGTRCFGERAQSTCLQGKDPPKVDSYRVVNLTSMVAKVLEFLILERLQSVFLEAGLPHVNQSAYRKAVSCADAIFATQEYSQVSERREQRLPVPV